MPAAPLPRDLPDSRSGDRQSRHGQFLNRFLRGCRLVQSRGRGRRQPDRQQYRRASRSRPRWSSAASRSRSRTRWAWTTTTTRRRRLRRVVAARDLRRPALRAQRRLRDPACVVGDVKHRTANGTLPDVLTNPESQALVVKFLESIDAQTQAVPLSAECVRAVIGPDAAHRHGGRIARAKAAGCLASRELSADMGLRAYDLRLALIAIVEPACCRSAAPSPTAHAASAAALSGR